MKKKFLLLLILCIFIITSASLALTLLYIDPFVNGYMGISVFIFSFIFSLSSFLTLIFYFFKKVFFRGQVFLYHVLTSFRQAFFIASFVVGLVVFKHYEVLNSMTFSLFLFMLILFELFLQNMSK